MPRRILRQDRLDAPQGPVPINLSHPLARGLVAARFAHMGIADLDLVAGLASETAGGVGSRTTRLGRVVRVFDFTNAGARWPMATPPDGNITILALATAENTSELDNNTFAFSSNDVIYTTYESGAFRLYIRNGGGFPNAAWSAALQVGRSYVTVGVRRGANLRELWVDGVLRATNTSAQGTAADYVRTGINYGEGNSSPAGQFTTNAKNRTVELVWNRALSDVEIELISVNPWQLLQSMQRSVTRGAGGADTSISTSPVGRASATAQLSTAIRLSASAQGTGTASMVLSTQLRLSASPTATATAASTLTTQVRLAATPTGTGTASTALVTQIRLAANATGTGLASFSLASGSAGELAFSATGRASASAALLTGISLQASATGNGGAIAQLSTAVQLQASPTAVGTATATLATQIRLAASPTGAGMATMALSTSAANELAFTATGRASASTNLSTQLLLVTSPTARAQAVAQLSTAIRISASPIARGSATAQLETGLAVLLVPARVRRAVPAVTLRRAVPTVHLRRAVPAP